MSKHPSHERFRGTCPYLGNSVLLQHRDNVHGLRDSDLWVPPSVVVEDMEGLENAARREFLEETGYILDVPRMGVPASRERGEHRG